MNQIPDLLDQVGPGWATILTDLHSKIQALQPDYDVGQLKEKFGGLRVYLNTLAPGVGNLIQQAEGESRKTCEMCGQPGEPSGRGWIKTLCDECRIPPSLRGA